MKEPGTKSYQTGLCGLVCVTLGVRDVKQIESQRVEACTRNIVQKYQMTKNDLSLNVNSKFRLSYLGNKSIAQRFTANELICLFV